MRKIKQERAQRVNVSMPQSTLDSIDKNLEKLRGFVIQKGVDPSRAELLINRSAFLRECCELLASDAGYTLLKGSFMALLGVEDDGQIEMNV